jgi:DMSO/TMAO reductase YedYZ molybdopterin-dependent catalytic subunit
VPPPAASFQVEGLTPLHVPNERFYRIDTALRVPQVDLERWRLRVTGMVERPFELSYDELLALPMEEGDITIACVSNEVGGDLVGNARWQGVPLARLLERAGVGVGASQVVGRAVDGWTAGFPTAAARDGRQALVAVGMNGEPLPLQHGFPARLIVPGLFGYVSATKWLEEIELATWDGFDAYWVPRGWAKEGPVVTQARIDVPRGGATVPAGEVVVAGVAWAPEHGIEAVEVSVAGGAWRAAELSEPLADSAWRQWRLVWPAEPGTHRLAVRATDGRGETQTPDRRPPRPSGATGHHRILVTVDPAA